MAHGASRGGLPASNGGYGNEQVFLRDVNGRWTYLDSGSGIVCQTDNDLRPETLKACQELGLR